MKIAISAFHFDDQRRIGSKRARSLAEEWSRAGHEVTVFTPGDPADTSSPYPGVDVIRLGNFGEGVSKSSQIIRKPLIAAVIAETVPRVAALKLKRRRGALSPEEDQEARNLNRRRQSSVLRVDQLLAEKDFRRNAKKTLQSRSISPDSFDVLLTRSVVAAGALRDAGFGAHWVHDLDDPATSEAFLTPLNYYLRSRQTRLLKNVDAAVAISEGVKETVTLSRRAAKFADKIKVVYNGFVRSEEEPTSVTLDAPGPLLVGFTGQVNARLEPELRRFLEVLRQALDEVGEGGIVFHYAGPSAELVAQVAQEVGVEDAIESSGLIPHDQALDLQSRMDALLVLSHNNPGARGILTGKFPEYLGASKPIIAVVGGTLPDSELGEIIERCNVGICSERARGEEGNRVLLDALVSWARDRAAGRSVPFAPVQEQVEEFNYANLAPRITEILQSVQ